MKKIHNKIKITGIVVSVILLLPWIASAKSNHDKKSFKAKVKKEDIVRSETGLNIPEWGIAIDAIYDPRLDDVIPGYHIVNLVLTNRRAEPIVLDVNRDKWIITDNMGREHRAYNHVKQISEKLWQKLPDKLKIMIDYPSRVNIGKSITIDVFVSQSVDLFNFREVLWNSASLNKEFSVFSNYESMLSINETRGREFDTPKTSATDTTAPAASVPSSHEEVLLPKKYSQDQGTQDQDEAIEIPDYSEFEEPTTHDPSTLSEPTKGDEPIMGVP